jgi:solute carrier family 35 protein F1/2
MFAFYSLVSVVMQRSSALMFNLQVLTSDFYVLMAGAFLFRYSFQSLYLVSFVAVIAGSVIYSVQRTREKSKREVSCFKRFVACLCPWVPLCCGDDWLPTPPPREYTVRNRPSVT